MVKYIWESAREMQDIIKTLRNGIEKPNFIEYITSNYKQFDCKDLGSEGCKFTLSFYYDSWERKACIKGIIKPTSEGCRIEAHQIQRGRTFDSIVFLAGAVMSYFLAIVALITVGFDDFIAASIVSGFFAISGLVCHLSYLKNEKNGKPKTPYWSLYWIWLTMRQMQNGKKVFKEDIWDFLKNYGPVWPKPKKISRPRSPGSFRVPASTRNFMRNWKRP